MPWALNPCPLGSYIRNGTARRVSSGGSDMSEWAPLMGRSGDSVEDVDFHALHIAKSDYPTLQEPQKGTEERKQS